MRRKLKNVFDKTARFMRKHTVSAATSATLSFGAAGGAAGASTQAPLAAAVTTSIVQPHNDNPSPDISSDTLYWKHKDYDIAIRSQPCEDRGLCLTIDYINIQDKSNRELMAQLKGYVREVSAYRPGGRGANSRTTRHVTDVERVQDWELQSYVGYRVNAQLEEISEGKWRGKIRSPFNWQSYGLDVKQLDDNTVKVSGYFTSFPLIKLSEKATRVDAPPPQQPYNWRTPTIS